MIAEFNRLRWLYPALIVGVLVAVYLPLILQQNDFRTDDYYLLTTLKEHGLPSPFDGQKYPFFSAFRVVPMLTLLFDHAMYGTNALGYYLLNLAVHIGSALLLFVLLRKLFATFFNKHGSLLPFLLALALGVHADVFYNVVWISNRTEGLLLFFYLAAVWSWLRFFERSHLGWYALGLIASLLALLSKEQAIHLPVLFLIAGAIFVYSGKTPLRWKQLAVFTLPLVALTAIILLLRWTYDPGASYIAGFFSPKKALSVVGINLIAFHPTAAKPLFIFFVEHKLIAAFSGLLLASSVGFALWRSTPRTRRIVFAVLLIVVATTFPRLIYHVFNRINSVQVVVILLALGIILLHLRSRWQVVISGIFILAQFAGLVYELHYWRIETDNGRYATLLEEEREAGPRKYRLLTYYHHLAPYVMHFQRRGDFGYDSSMQRTPLYIDRRYGSRRGPEFSIQREGASFTFQSTDPRTVFLCDTSVALPEGTEIQLSTAAPDYGYRQARVHIRSLEPRTVYMIERDIRFEQLFYVNEAGSLMRSGDGIY